MNKIITTSPEETIEFAKKIGAVLKKGDVIAYKGGLGAGKTTFTRGLAMGAGLEDEVYSPTFALINEYAGDVNIYHFDMYRIENENEALEFGVLDYFNNKNAIIGQTQNLYNQATNFGMNNNLADAIDSFAVNSSLIKKNAKSLQHFYCC